MKYLGNRPTGEDKDIEYPVFVFSPDELHLISELLINKEKECYKSDIRYISLLGRLRNMNYVLHKYYQDKNDIKKYTQEGIKKYSKTLRKLANE